ncbi:hypothetical protein E1295_32770 [Nonomuraea mesophila]|uniref:DUF3558 domain-containing protein n=1 Tax=Nonomuraea mesophila TaxID=2530382 RepID=A0A4R5EWU1_9ACTN|nr:hypothetical protein [Nonomuraea mesophila]TDE39499.1 hypothetical protein E1295_32770 [Nonomuraea mesophila]
MLKSVRTFLGILLLGVLLLGCGDVGQDATAASTGPSPNSSATRASQSPAATATTAPARPFTLPKDCDDPRLAAAMGALIKGKKFDKRYDSADHVTCSWGKKIPTAGVTIALPSAKPKYKDFPEVEVSELSALGVEAQSGGTEIAVGDRTLYTQAFVVSAPQFRLTVDQMSEERHDDDLREAAVALTTWLTS